MSDEQYVIELEDDTEGHLFSVESDDPELADATRGDRLRIRFRPDEDGDTVGHVAGATLTVRALIGEDDTEGHAISLHFPTAQEADAFRRRLMVAGALTGAIAVGSIGAVGLSNLPAGEAASDAGRTTISQQGPLDAHEAPAFQANQSSQGGIGGKDARVERADAARGAGAATESGDVTQGGNAGGTAQDERADEGIGPR